MEDPLAQPHTPRRHGLGVRVQLMVVLGIGFGLSVLLLGLATTRLGARAIDHERMESAEGMADAFLHVETIDVEHLGELVGNGGVVGVEVLEDDVAVAVVGEVGHLAVERRAGARTVIVHLDSAEMSTAGALPGLLFLYVGLTAAVILLLTYVLLTRLIVRPLAALTRASERIAAGKEAVVPVEGTAELSRLAVSFNEMQKQLSHEKEALRARLEELEATTAELQTTQQSLVRSEKLASVGRLAAGIAHEIGNPLSAISGLVELVETGDLEPDEQREFLGRVRKETERINRIIRDLLDFARSEPTEHEVDATCDLVLVVEDAVRLVGPQADLRQVTLERRFEDDVPRVRGSAARLAQVVLNLLLNAADAIGGEGTIRLEVTADEDMVRLVVHDTGPGIPEAVLAEIFEPFVTTKPPGQGTGLGLAVCQTLVEQLGGALIAENAPEGGARFTVRLPAA
ncbi:MAG: HAMP domain-containing protein [Myxococcales bacterium]|nr:HAMP domain-containing protein [Myxococcales bacterium]